MKKKIIVGIVAVVIILILGIGSYYLFRNKNKAQEENNNSNDKKILVVYYSAQGHTEDIAKKIARNLDADLFEIEPVDVYTSEDLDWTNNNSRVTKEHNDESLRSIKLKNTKVTNWDNYDTILIGYPIWWGIAAWPVNNFVRDNDFRGKTVIPFCTSASSGMGNSAELLKEMSNGGKWENGKRFSATASDKDIEELTNKIDKGV